MERLLLAKEFNNYFNRTIKRYKTANEYRSKLKVYSEITNINFVPADGITTSQVINWSEDWTPDYCVVLDKSGDNVISRWFVIESTRNRGNQFYLTLKRDSIADYYDIISTSTAYITKGFVGKDNPLIFNDEGQNFSQIKKTEIPLKDASNCAWVVGYLADNGDDKMSAFKGDLSVSYGLDAADIEVPDITQWEYYSFKDSNICTSLNYGWVSTRTAFYNANNNLLTTTSTAYISGAYEGTNPVGLASFENDRYLIQPHFDGDTQPSNKYFIDEYPSIILNNMYKAFATLDNEAHAMDKIYQKLKSYDGKTIKDTSTGILYKISLVDNFDFIEESDWAEDTFFDNYVTKSFTYNGVQFTLTGTSQFSSKFSYNSHILKIEELVDAKVTLDFTLPDKSPVMLKDAPYYMFAIPYGDTPIGSATGFKTPRQLALNAASAFSTQLGSRLYDVQILPYCPINGIMSDGYLKVFNNEKVNQYFKDKNENNVGIIYWANYSNFSLNITITAPGDKRELSSIEFKRDAETTLYRLCAPNYSGNFDWSPYKNDASFGLTRTCSFDVDCCYKPYSPYIHVSPVFSYMYGSDFRDSRGLICGGDFSLTQVNSQWTQYQINNKNYQNIFDRQIANLDFKQSQANIASGLNILTSAVGGATSGAGAGLMAGGPIAAIAGGIGGGAAGLGSSITDYFMEKAARAEDRSYTIDMYNFHLGNVKAMPYSLTKVSAMTNNYKYWPFVEVYEASKQEKDTFLKKLMFDGMTLSIITTVKEAIKDAPITEAPGKYVRGKLINVTGIGEDNHLVKDINSELNEGLYITEEV